MLNKIEKIIVAIVVVMCIMISILTPILLKKCDFGETPDGPIKSSNFETTLSAEEHLHNIIKRTEEKFAKEILDGTITEYNAYTVYNFSNQPEYFLVELKYSQPKTYEYDELLVDKYITKDCAMHGETERYDFEKSYDGNKKFSSYYEHIFGYIENDKYLCDLWHYPRNAINGPSLWHTEGVLDKKLYYGVSVLGYGDGDKIVGWEAVGHGGFSGLITISPDEFEWLTNTRYRPTGGSLY